jgi:CheY-like chemotaxis protein
MGGTLTASSPGQGQGTTFELRIPAEEALPVEMPPSASRVMPDLTGRHAVVVDDNPTNQRILATHLGRWGFTVRSTGTAEEALTWLDAGERFELFVLDMLLPGTDGARLAADIRSRSPDGTRPAIVIVTSLGGRPDLPEGVAAVIPKPVKPSQLLDAVLLALEGPGQLGTPVRGPDRPTLDAELGVRHPLRILLAEDNPVNRRLAVRLLERMGYAADIAVNGVEAVDAAARTTYDLVLMDVQMPEMDGLDATRHIIAGAPHGARPTIIAMTANALAGDREACIAAGMDGYLSKPIQVDELATALAATIRRPDPSGVPGAGA